MNDKFQNYVREEISLLQQVIWKIEQARDITKHTTGGNNELLMRQFDLLIDDAQRKINALYEKLPSRIIGK